MGEHSIERIRSFYAGASVCAYDWPLKENFGIGKSARRMCVVTMVIQYLYGCMYGRNESQSEGFIY